MYIVGELFIFVSSLTSVSLLLVSLLL